MLGRLLNKELSGEVAYQTEPHDRALLYYRLLIHGVDAVRCVAQDVGWGAGRGVRRRAWGRAHRVGQGRVQSRAQGRARSTVEHGRGLMGSGLEGRWRATGLACVLLFAVQAHSFIIAAIAALPSRNDRP